MKTRSTRKEIVTAATAVAIYEALNRKVAQEMVTKQYLAHWHPYQKIKAPTAGSADHRPGLKFNSVPVQRTPSPENEGILTLFHERMLLEKFCSLIGQCLILYRVTDSLYLPLRDFRTGVAPFIAHISQDIGNLIVF